MGEMQVRNAGRAPGADGKRAASTTLCVQLSDSWLGPGSLSTLKSRDAMRQESVCA